MNERHEPQAGGAERLVADEGTPVRGSESGPRMAALTWRSVGLALLLATIGALWVRKVSLVAHTCQVAEGTPSVPALTALVALSGLAALWWRVRRSAGDQRRQLARRELLIVYVFLSLAVPLSAANVMRQLLPNITALQYFAQPENNYAALHENVPPWLMPQDAEAVRVFYEGADGQPFDWAAWRAPMTTWTGLFLVYSLSLLCVVSLFRRPWAEHERLTFPLADLALQLAPAGQSSGRGRHLLAQPLFWAGFAAGTLFNLANIGHAFSPQVAALGQGYDLGQLLTKHPWTGLRPLYLAFRPEIVGLGYLVPTEVLFSSWLFYLVMRLEGFGATVLGYSQAGFPFEWPQGTGAYLGLAAATFYGARWHLRRVFSVAFLGGKAGDEEREEALPYRWAAWGALGGFVAVVGLFIAAGMRPAIAVLYAALSYTAALIYCRVRAQTGLPISYILPRRDVPLMVQQLLPSGPALALAGLRSETALAALAVLNRMTFPHIAAFELESIRMGDLARLRRRDLLLGIALALGVGWALSGLTHMTAYHGYGANVLDGGTVSGGWRTRQALIAYDRLEARTTARTPIDVPQNLARLWGLVLTLALVGLRARFLRFPLHPLGPAIAATFGYHTWFPLFVAWALKAVMLRLGGPRLYRRAMAPFLGLAIGHFLVAGAVWGVVGAIDEEVAKRYLVWFA